MRRALLAGAALVGAAAVGLAWLFLGTGSNSSVSASLASLGAAPGIAPPDYAYLDTAQVALYLGQLQGGIAKSEQLTQQLTKSRTSGLNAGGLSAGGETGSSATAERVVTPTATARFYQLLDLLGHDGYLHKIDAAASPKRLIQAFAKVPGGSFVQLENCKLLVPSFVQLEQLSLASEGTQSVFANYLAATASGLASGAPTSANAVIDAQLQAGGANSSVGPSVVRIEPRQKRRLVEAIPFLEKVGPNPRVPLATCDGQTDYHPRGVDLLFPIRLAHLSAEQSLLAGPVTLVGKLVRAVRDPDEPYVDNASLATFAGPTQRIQNINLQGDNPGMGNELDADAVVLAPGAVILPIAIYK